MLQLSPWLVASLLLVSALFYLAFRVHRTRLLQLDGQRRQAEQVAELHLMTIEAMVMAIDAKDQTAPDHLHRIQVYAAALARALGMSEGDIQAIRTAALLHDIGKLAVPEHILAKAGPLTVEEQQRIRIHPQVGAAIIANLPFPQPVAPLVLSHHERWDGRGYPAGLKGDEIPAGARVLCIVDHFDALTTERPYHNAIAVDAAIALLQQESGKALDPRMVETFVRIQPQAQAEAGARHRALPVLTLPVSATDQPAPPELVPGVDTKPTALDDIALAHREIYALYQIAQTMGTSPGLGDTMTLISSRLSNLVPFSACALFIYSESTDSLDCRFATGTDSELIQQLTLKSGQGLAGWVARNRRPLVNARPGAEFEAAGSTLPTTLQSALVCPLIFGDRFIGTLNLYHTTAGFYRDDHRRLLDRVCEQAAAVIHNSIVFEQTQEASLTDPLTGLPNTRFMLMHLSRELSRAERLRAEVSLLVMDLNDFKEINDSFGHHVGDRALREVARVLRLEIRPYDICVRYAGDEFIVVLAGCGREEAENKKLELQAAIDGVVFEARPGNRRALSISAGAAVFPHDGVSYESLLAKADSRMYDDKSRRKQRQRERGGATGGRTESPVGRP